MLWVGKEGKPDVGAACAMAMSWTSDGPTVENILMANKTVAELKQICVENKPQGGYIIAFADGIASSFVA